MRKRMYRKLLVLPALAFMLTSCNTVTVPNVVGEEASYAKGILKGQGFEIEVSEKIEDGVRPGQVLNQEPSAQLSTKKGSKVKLFVAKSPVYTISGSLKLVDSDIGGSDDACYGTGGYDDIGGFMSVTIRDGNKNIISTGKTGEGKKNDYVTCIFDFEVNNVPKSEFCTIEIGHRGELNYSFNEIKEKNWKIELALS